MKRPDLVATNSCCNTWFRQSDCFDRKHPAFLGGQWECPSCGASTIANDRMLFEYTIQRYSLEFLSPRITRVEDANFPPMVNIYQTLRGPSNTSPPTQRRFTEEVMRRMDELSNADHAAITARLYRTYTAMIQQHHFELVLRENFDAVEWDPKLDMQHGIDLVVQDNGRHYGFTVSVQTERADFYKSRKAKHYDRPPFPVLDVKIHPWEYTVGRFWLYNPTKADELHAFVDMNVAREAATR